MSCAKARETFRSFSDLPPMLRVRGLKKSYDGTGVLRGVDLALAPGEFTALMGESGSGKSTLLNLVAGIDVPDSGLIEFNGVSLNTLNDDQRTRLRRRHMGFIFQFFNLLENLTVRANVEIPLHLNGIPTGQTVDRILERVGLLPQGDSPVYRLSGGERQRVAIARAVVHGPDLILADEPTGSLDAAHSDAVLSLIAELGAESRTTVLMATHSNRVAGRAHRIVVMEDGLVRDL